MLRLHSAPRQCQGFKVTPAYPSANPTSYPPTCISVAVPHGMDGMLAFTSTLDKGLGGQILGHQEGFGLGRITNIHNLIDCVQAWKLSWLSSPRPCSRVLSLFKKI